MRARPTRIAGRLATHPLTSGAPHLESVIQRAQLERCHSLTVGTSHVKPRDVHGEQVGGLLMLLLLLLLLLLLASGDNKFNLKLKFKNR